MNYELREFINTFNFPEPDWSNLPAGFPNLDKTGLTKEESHLLDGITLAWVTSEGRDFFAKRYARRALVGTTIILLILFGNNLLAKAEKSITKSVSAKTVTEVFEDIIISTMSAVFRK